MHPPVPHRSSSSSLAGAIIDLTGDDGPEDGVRKKRKLDHYSALVAGPSDQPSGSIDMSLLAPSGSSNGMSGQMSPAQTDMPRPEMPTSSQHPIVVGLASAVPAAAVAADQQAGIRIPPPAQPQPLPAAVPVSVHDTVMEEQEQQTTVEEDCLEANFDEDEEDETKQWCRMCRSV